MKLITKEVSNSKQATSPGRESAVGEPLVLRLE
jgi:hypothetical protein